MVVGSNPAYPTKLFFQNQQLRAAFFVPEITRSIFSTFCKVIRGRLASSYPLQR
ncbi:hypothetical protein QWZ13_08485 [Reinekea marina]|uniref:hypothetical protein n=1 Tax=Reinekea marina TaxID=1310421 RepID=UPI0025B39717|nr:hypothetical protein [Reinekea marina]MDN3648946.1 hypothetical protein [Reinekea marina]